MMTWPTADRNKTISPLKLAAVANGARLPVADIDRELTVVELQFESNDRDYTARTAIIWARVSAQ